MQARTSGLLVLRRPLPLLVEAETEVPGCLGGQGCRWHINDGPSQSQYLLLHFSLGFCMALALALELLSGTKDPKTKKTDPSFPKAEGEAFFFLVVSFLSSMGLSASTPRNQNSYPI